MMYQYQYRQQQQNRLPTMEKDVVEAIETATPTNDKQNKDLFIAVELDDTGEDGDGDEGPVIIRFRTDRYRY